MAHLGLGFSQILGMFWGVPMEHCSMLGSTLGSPYLGKLSSKAFVMISGECI